MVTIVTFIDNLFVSCCMDKLKNKRVTWGDENDEARPNFLFRFITYIGVIDLISVSVSFYC